MNNFEQIFNLALTLEEPDRSRTLVWLWRKGLELKKICLKYGNDVTGLDRTLVELKNFI